MYAVLLTLHSLLRWFVLGAGLAAVFFAIAGWRGNNPWTKRDRVVGAVFTGFLDLQFLLGLLLYFVSPVLQAAFSNFGAAMKEPSLRFFAVEHMTGMLIAVVLVHVGRVLSKKAPDDAGKHKQAARFFVFALAIMLLAIPWPGMAWGRPLFRFGA
ncbi:MAG: hypothetical protein ACK4N5_01740 [Myxococcales bacterium]